MDKVKVTYAAVVSRLKRNLEKEGKALKKSRARWANDNGTFYVVDIRSNVIESQHVDPIQWASEAGLIKGWEVVE